MHWVNGCWVVRFDERRSGGGTNELLVEVLKEARKWWVSEQEAPKGKVSERKNVLKLHHFLEAHRSETHEKNRDFVVMFSFLANHGRASIFFVSFRLLWQPLFHDWRILGIVATRLDRPLNFTCCVVLLLVCSKTTSSIIELQSMIITCLPGNSALENNVSDSSNWRIWSQNTILGGNVG